MFRVFHSIRDGIEFSFPQLRPSFNTLQVQAIWLVHDAGVGLRSAYLRQTNAAEKETWGRSGKK